MAVPIMIQLVLKDGDNIVVSRTVPYAEWATVSDILYRGRNYRYYGGTKVGEAVFLLVGNTKTLEDEPAN